MLDPSRYSLDAATVGFRKRMKQTVNWESFEKAVQTQTDAIKVRRELEETPISEIHVMGGGLYGIANDEKTKTYARQQRQINGYVLRSFISHGGPIVLPPKHGEGLLMTPMNMGQRQYGGYNSIVGNYVSSFTEPLQAPLDNNTMLLAKAGIAMASNSASSPYARLQFNMNMHLTQEEINKNQAQFIEQRQYNVQKDIAKELRQEESLQFSGKKRKDLMAELGDRARTEATPQNPIAAAERRGRGVNIRQQNEVAAALVAANQSGSETSRAYSPIRTTASSRARKARLNKTADIGELDRLLASGSSSSASESYSDMTGASSYDQHGFDSSSAMSSSGKGKQHEPEPEGTFSFAPLVEVQRIRDERARLAIENTPVEKALQVTLSDGSTSAQDLQSKTESAILNRAKGGESLEQKTATKSLMARGANVVNQLFLPTPTGINELATPAAIYFSSPQSYEPQEGGGNVGRLSNVQGSFTDLSKEQIHPSRLNF